MQRHALKYLVDWHKNARRKPLIIRGSRQVGKSYLARELANTQFASLVEINFEESPDLAGLFKGNSPQEIVRNLEVHTGQRIVPGKTLLFLDEIQAAPQVLATLRFFYEKMPEFHVVAAGSLLEFVLEKHDFSMPVGRIEYMHIGPVTFEEFLEANGQQHLAERLQSFHIGEPLPPPTHKQLLKAMQEFCIVGGMPEAVQAFADTQSFLECDRLKQSILSTYADDFNKYGTINTARVQRVFQRLPHMVGSKFIYSRVDRDESSREIGQALHMLCLARVASKVYHSASNGVPLGAEINERNFKVLFLDTGLLCRTCGLSLNDFEREQDILLVNTGAICEQFIGQHLLQSGEYFDEPVLHYWSREKRQSSAEVDYVLSVGPHIIPIEVKAGKTGRLKSMHMFLKEKQRHFGLRFNADLPSMLDTQDTLPTGETVSYRLLSLPLYMVGQTRRLIRENLPT